MTSASVIRPAVVPVFPLFAGAGFLDAGAVPDDGFTGAVAGFFVADVFIADPFVAVAFIEDVFVADSFAPGFFGAGFRAAGFFVAGMGVSFLRGAADVVSSGIRSAWEPGTRGADPTALLDTSAAGEPRS